ncbi:unnamed protein product [Amoebophrya sp. A120]|nr:unnamed protein product [Amoebophrya sp. A120]|eukprot:GSA120T00008333001.1
MGGCVAKSAGKATSPTGIFRSFSKEKQDDLDARTIPGVGYHFSLTSLSSENIGRLEDYPSDPALLAPDDGWQVRRNVFLDPFPTYVFARTPAYETLQEALQMCIVLKGGGVTKTVADSTNGGTRLFEVRAGSKMRPSPLGEISWVPYPTKLCRDEDDSYLLKLVEVQSEISHDLSLSRDTSKGMDGLFDNSAPVELSERGRSNSARATSGQTPYVTIIKPMDEATGIPMLPGARSLPAAVNGPVLNNIAPGSDAAALEESLAREKKRVLESWAKIELDFAARACPVKLKIQSHDKFIAGVYGLVPEKRHNNNPIWRKENTNPSHKNRERGKQNVFLSHTGERWVLSRVACPEAGPLNPASGPIITQGPITNVDNMSPLVDPVWEDRFGIRIADKKALEEFQPGHTSNGSVTPPGGGTTAASNTGTTTTSANMPGVILSTSANNAGASTTTVDPNYRSESKEIEIAGLYVDLTFPPSDKALTGTTTLDHLKPHRWKEFEPVWMRAGHLFKGQSVRLYEQITPLDFQSYSSVLDSQWIMAALSSLAEYPNYLEDRIFVDKGDTNNLRGEYKVNLFDIGMQEWVTVTVDDHLPCDGRKLSSTFNQPLFAQPVRTQIFPCIAEKAFAKLYGSYSALEPGQCGFAWLALTGTTRVERWSISNPFFQQKEQHLGEEGTTSNPAGANGTNNNGATTTTSASSSGANNKNGSIERENSSTSGMNKSKKESKKDKKNRKGSGTINTGSDEEIQPGPQLPVPKKSHFFSLENNSDQLDYSKIFGELAVPCFEGNRQVYAKTGRKEGMEDLWTYLVDCDRKNYILTGGISPHRRAPSETCGLLPGQTYTILKLFTLEVSSSRPTSAQQAKEIQTNSSPAGGCSTSNGAQNINQKQTVRLVQLRNRFLEFAWRGRWHPACPLWCNLPMETRQQLEPWTFNFNAGNDNNRPSSSNGAFYVQWEDFVCVFQSVGVCKKRDLGPKRGAAIEHYRNTVTGSKFKRATTGDLSASTSISAGPSGASIISPGQLSQSQEGSQDNGVDTV